jgi:regulator of replication initiation timing
MSEQRIESLERELRCVYDNLTATQERCNELLESNRKLKEKNADLKQALRDLIHGQNPDEDTY